MRQIIFILALALAACGNLRTADQVSRLSPTTGGPEHLAMLQPGVMQQTGAAGPFDGASLWNGGRRSLLGDRRAVLRGDILTVVVEIDEKAEISKGLLPLLPVTPDVDRPSTFQARFLDRAGRCAGAFGLGEVGFECCQAGWRAGTRP